LKIVITLSLVFLSVSIGIDNYSSANENPAHRCLRWVLQDISGSFSDVRGGPVTLYDGSVIEGSSRFGGMQPDYIINLEHPAMKPLIIEARNIGKNKFEFWEKIDSVINLVKNNLKRGEYNSSQYFKLLNKYNEEGGLIPIGEYVAAQCGVCRENAVLTHLLLEEAGIDSKYLYVTAQSGARIEDHAIVLVQYQNETWVVDSYFPAFHGRKYSDLLRGSRQNDQTIPRELEAWKPVQILEMNQYPRFMIPNKK